MCVSPELPDSQVSEDGLDSRFCQRLFYSCHANRCKNGKQVNKFTCARSPDPRLTESSCTYSIQLILPVLWSTRPRWAPICKREDFLMQERQEGLQVWRQWVQDQNLGALGQVTTPLNPTFLSEKNGLTNSLYNKME